MDHWRCSTGGQIDVVNDEVWNEPYRERIIGAVRALPTPQSVHAEQPPRNHQAEVGWDFPVDTGTGRTVVEIPEKDNPAVPFHRLYQLPHLIGLLLMLCSVRRWSNCAYTWEMINRWTYHSLCVTTRIRMAIHIYVHTVLKEVIIMYGYVYTLLSKKLCECSCMYIITAKEYTPYSYWKMLCECSYISLTLYTLLQEVETMY